MATQSLNNYRNKIYVECIENLIKAEALVDFVLHNDISDIPLHTIHDYFWVLSDFVKQAKQSHETLGCLLNY